MRKLLLTSTALVAATSMINYASADVSVSGGFEWGYTSQSSEIAASNGDSYRVDNEVVISFTNKTDTGLTITGRYDVDGDAASVDESSITIAGGFGTDSSSGNMTSSEDQGEVNPIEADDVCELLMSSKKVMIIPGYGMAVAQAQHTVNEIVKVLQS